MISPLRTWHRRIVILLTIALPLLVLAALSARQIVAPVAEFPVADPVEARTP